MSKQEADTQRTVEDVDDGPDDWDKRIFSTGCSEEQFKMNDCYYAKKDWRACKEEICDNDLNHSRQSTPPSTSPAKTSTSASLASGLSDVPIKLQEDDPAHIDWTSSFHGLSVAPFAKEAADILLAPLDPLDIEIKPDGIIYLPEIKYRRILNKAFGPGGWGLAPRGETIVTDKSVTREYALLAHGRLVSIARGEQDYFSKEGIPTASEGCKSNAMMRCCKDLGVASELWDPRFIREFKSKNAKEVFVEHQITKRKTKITLRKGDPVTYPYKETKYGS